MTKKIILTTLAIATIIMLVITIYNLIVKNYNIACIQSLSTVCFITSFAIIKSIKKQTMKQTIVIQPIRWRGTPKEKWEEPIQVETREEAMKITEYYMSRQDDWWSVILDDCGLYDEEEIKKIKEKNEELPF